MADFDTMFGLMNPQGLDPLAVGQALIQNPESLAPVLAQMGPPPPIGPVSNPDATSAPPGVPMPAPRPNTQPGAPLDLAAVGGMPTGPGGTQPAQPSNQQRMNAFTGVKQPTAPQPQRISSPNAPRPSGTIQQGQLLALMQQFLGERANPQQFRLGQALGGIR